jgi:V/A-type H+-transporting ATPase subunit A
MTNLLHRGDSIQQMMQVTGEEGVTVPDYVTYQKALLVDMVYLQQDAFDEVDVSAPLERQKQCFGFLYDLVTREYKFDDKEQVRDYFLRLTGLFKNFNYSGEDSPDRAKYLKQMEELADSVSVVVH